MAIWNLDVQLTDEHVKRLANCRPVEAMNELVWNAFDSSATEISISVHETELGGIAQIEIVDNGDGISYESVESTFGNLGKSIKAGEKVNSRGMPMHGRRGEGRFRAYSLGESVVWETTNKKGDYFSISGAYSKAKSFEISSLNNDTKRKKGTKFIAKNVLGTQISLPQNKPLRERLAATFAPRLIADPSARLILNGELVDPRPLIADQYYEVIKYARGEIKLNLVIWNYGKKKDFFWCDASGNARDHEEIRSSLDVSFSAYVSCKEIDEAIENNIFTVKDLSGLGDIKYTSIEKVREIIESYSDKVGAKVIEGLKDKGIYPFSRPPNGEIEVLTRGVFDACAAKIFTSIKSVYSSSQDSQSLTLRLIKNAIQKSPEEMGKILQDLFGASDEQISDLYYLLKRTTLAGLISTGHLVADRLDFLNGLRQITMARDYKKVVRERTELHKILEKETWVFGEGFSLGTSDETLQTVLDFHRKVLKPNFDEIEIEDDDDVQRKRIPDLVLSTQSRQGDDGGLLHLVVELKRPSVKIDFEEKSQIERYTALVANDPNFDKERTSWVFYVISSDIDPQISNNYLGKGPSDKGQLSTTAPNMKIFVKTWGQILQDAHTRMAFLKEKLDIQSGREEGINYLSKKFPNIMEKIEERKEVASMKKKSGLDGVLPSPSLHPGAMTPESPLSDHSADPQV